MTVWSLVRSAATTELHGVAGWMASLIDALGAIGVGVIILVETVFPPIPSEVVLPAAGYLAAIGEIGFWATAVWATIGSVVGALTLYWAGAAVGPERLGRLAERLPLMAARDVERAWITFDRWQQPTIFWGRLVPGVRSLVSIPAGARRMPLPRFVVLTAAGSLLWNLTLLGAGWWLGDRYGDTAAVSRWVEVAVVAAAVVGVAWFVGHRLRGRSGA